MKFDMSDEDFEDEMEELREPTRSDRRIKGIEYRQAREGVFDYKTLEALETLKKMKVVKEMLWVVSTGKEADVFYGKSWDDEDIAIKIYRIHTSKFKRIDSYILGDRRFGRVRSNIKLKWSWARREFKNLKLAFRAGASVPEPIRVHRNIVVMKFIGKEGVPAPLLKDVEYEELEDPEGLFRAIINDIEKLYKNARLVHADLSPFNILYMDGKHYLIDFAQGMKIDQEYAHKYLYRDIYNIVSYFSAILDEAPDPDEIYKKITGKEVDPYFKMEL